MHAVAYGDIIFASVVECVAEIDVQLVFVRPFIDTRIVGIRELLASRVE